jgi:lipoprotein-anchoring transpeptidase ErfK/SrfK
VPRQADPAFARKVVSYSTSVPPGTIVIDPADHVLYLVPESIRLTMFSIWYQSGGQAIRYGPGSAVNASDGRARLAFTPSRNGRTGMRPPGSGSPNSENI